MLKYQVSLKDLDFFFYKHGTIFFPFFFCLFQHCKGIIKQIQILGSIQQANMREDEKPRAEDKFCGISRLKVQKYFSNFLWMQLQLFALTAIQQELKYRLKEWTVWFFLYL